MLRGFVFSLAVMLLATMGASAAFAQTAGSLINSAATQISSFVEVINMMAWCAGCFLCVVAIFKFKDHVDNPAQNPISAGIKRFVAGGMFFSLPGMKNVAIASIMGDITANQKNVIGSTSTGLNSALVNPSAMDGMIVKFMQDIALPMQFLLSVAIYMFAGGFLLLGISRLTKRMDEGPRGPAGMGTIMTFITSGVLFAFGDMAGAFSESFFGTSTVKGIANVDPNNTLGLSAADAARINQVIQALMLFIIIVGIIAFVRGWLVLRAFADGQQGATLAQGLTFLIGGVLAINLGPLINVIQSTLGINGITFS